MSHLVTIKTCFDQTEASMIRSLLESEGIFCFLQDELTVQVDPLYTAAIGGIKLQVRQEDAERAIELLKQKAYACDEDFRPTKFEVWLDKFLRKTPLIKRFYDR